MATIRSMNKMMGGMLYHLLAPWFRPHHVKAVAAAVSSKVHTVTGDREEQGGFFCVPKVKVGRDRTRYYGFLSYEPRYICEFSRRPQSFDAN